MKFSYLGFAIALVVLAGMSSAQGPVTSASCSGFLNSASVQQYAPWYCSYINQAAQNAWQQWMPVAFVAIMVSFLIGVIILMAGIAVRNPTVRDFGVGELYESMATALIVIFFAAVVAVVFGIIPSIFVGPVNPYITALSYNNNLIMAAQNLDSTMFNIYVVDSYYVTAAISISGKASGVSAGLQNLASIFKAGLLGPIYIFVLTPAQAIGDLLTSALILLHVEFYLLLFGMYASIPVFLVPGIIFRAFLPTRSVGGMMIATAIGFYMIMPILFSVAYYFTNQNSLQQLDSANSQLQQYGAGTGAQTNAQYVDSPLSTTFANLKTSLGSFWIAIFFFPDIIIAITYAMIITLSEFIGGMKANSGRLLRLI